jgi:hypothetical protein
LQSPNNTQIRVSNSILSPNTFHFSTKVTLARKVDQIPESADIGTQEHSSIITNELTSPKSQRAYMSLLKQTKPSQSPSKSVTPEKPQRSGIKSQEDPYFANNESHQLS